MYDECAQVIFLLEDGKIYRFADDIKVYEVGNLGKKEKPQFQLKLLSSDFPP